MTPMERGLTWDDITLLVRRAQRDRTNVEDTVAAHCNVDRDTARAWVRKVNR